jgi:protein-serine/threonine kinase
VEANQAVVHSQQCVAKGETAHRVAALKNFEIVRCLGKGDVGTVFLVKENNGDKVYALKVLKKQEVIKRKKEKRVYTERKILELADCPYIVRLEKSFQSKSYLYFVLEYCPGGDLFRVLQKQPHKRLPETVARFYAAEILLSLDYLHSHLGSVYRDLKPENVLIRANGHLALADFDLSTSPFMITLSKNSSRQKGANVEKRQRHTSFVGTEEYISPELLSGGLYSGAVDWWTFGILVFEMLYGKTPFASDNKQQTFARISAAKLDIPAEPADISPQAKDLLRKLLKQNPHHRLGSSAGADDLKRHRWFSAIKFDTLLEETPPLIPTLKHATDTRYFRRFKVSESDLDFQAAVTRSPLVSCDKLPFDNPWKRFTYFDRSAPPAVPVSTRLASPSSPAFSDHPTHQILPSSFS